MRIRSSCTYYIYKLPNLRIPQSATQVRWILLLADILEVTCTVFNILLILQQHGQNWPREIVDLDWIADVEDANDHAAEALTNTPVLRSPEFDV